MPKGSFQPPGGLAGWWPGDGSAKDVVGHNDGIALAGASPSRRPCAARDSASTVITVTSVFLTLHRSG